MTNKEILTINFNGVMKKDILGIYFKFIRNQQLIKETIQLFQSEN